MDDRQAPLVAARRRSPLIVGVQGVQDCRSTAIGSSDDPIHDHGLAHGSHKKIASRHQRAPRPRLRARRDDSVPDSYQTRQHGTRRLCSQGNLLTACEQTSHSGHAWAKARIWRRFVSDSPFISETRGLPEHAQPERRGFSGSSRVSPEAARSRPVPQSSLLQPDLRSVSMRCPRAR
jgi:hypothetical protein